MFENQSQPPNTPISSASDATKQELTAGLQMSITSQANATRSKPQACKVCGKMLSSGGLFCYFILLFAIHCTHVHPFSFIFQSTHYLFHWIFSASSYYVHMKLHSGTKPFACTVSMYDPMRDALFSLFFLSNFCLFNFRDSDQINIADQLISFYIFHK